MVFGSKPRGYISAAYCCYMLVAFGRPNMKLPLQNVWQHPNSDEMTKCVFQTTEYCDWIAFCYLIISKVTDSPLQSAGKKS